MPEDGKQLKDLARKHYEEPQTRGFLLTDVSRDTWVNAKVQRSYVIMNKKEASKAMGQDIRSKDPALKTVELVNQAGESESVFVFADESAPFRKLILEGCVGEHSTVHLMDKDTHLHQEQGTMTMKASTTKRMKDSDIQALLAPGAANVIVSPEEYRCKLQRKHARMSGSVADGEFQENEGLDEKEKQSTLVIELDKNEEDGDSATAAPSTMTVAAQLEQQASCLLDVGAHTESPPCKAASSASAKKSLEAIKDCDFAGNPRCLLEPVGLA